MRAFAVSIAAALLGALLSPAEARTPAEAPTPPETTAAMGAAGEREPVRLALDAREAPSGVLHAHLRFPVSGGALTLAYPKWIPGEHSPGGPISQMVRLVFQADGRRLPWHRDDDDIYVFHVEVPAGARYVDADLDFACTIGETGFRVDICSSYDQLVVNWWVVALYPPSVPIAREPYAASIRLPPGWHYASALAAQGTAADGSVEFRTVPLVTLVDSPLIAAAHLRSFPLGGARGASLDLSAETAAALEVPGPVLAHFRRLIAEAEALFDGPRYRQYHLLVSLGDDIDHYTLEHRESSENRLPTLGFSDPRLLRTSASTIPHEYVHAWNGKYRTPRGLDIGTYQDTMRARLIWVYEGLTDYASNVLTARSGFWSEEDFAQSLAFDAAQMRYHTGRTWRSLEDTTIGARMLLDSEAWSSARRNTDFYPESGLVWLDADTLIRERSGGKRSLDDFCKAFFGAASTDHPYDFEDIVAALNAIEPYDWAGFLRARLDSTEAEPPLDGIARSGWHLEYREAPTSLMADMRAVHKVDLLWPLWGESESLDLRSSIGVLVEADGRVLDAAPGLVGYAAGLRPGMRLVAVNGQRFSLAALEQAVRETRHGGALALDARNGTHLEHARLDYREGLRWPHLVRDAAKPDVLATILAPRTPAKP